MAMEIVATDPAPGSVASRSVGWRTWCALIGLLEHLGADVSKAAMANDGDPVDAATATDWAERLGTVVGRTQLANYEEEFEFVVDGEAIRSAPMPGFSLAMSSLFGLPSGRSSEPVEVVGIEDISESLTEISEFLRGAGGFTQC